MYHCRLHIYFTGLRRAVFQVIREMPPLERFTHDYLESGPIPLPAGEAKAKLLLGHGQGPDVMDLLQGIRQQGELIPLRQDDQLGLPGTEGRLADQPVPGGHHQQHPQPGLV